MAIIATCGYGKFVDLEDLQVDARQEFPDPKEYGPTSKQAWNKPDANGHYQVDDMLLNEDQFKFHYGSEEEKRNLSRNAMPGNQYRWTDGVMPYKFGSDVTEPNKEKVRSAIALFNEHLSGCLTIR